MSFWFLFAPGAGAPSSSPWMESWRERISHIAPVLTFDYPYRLKGSSRPDPLPVLVEHHLTALRRGKEQYGEKAILVGKSMGSRVGCHVAALEPCRGAVCLGYPLRSQSGKVRSATLLELPSPLLCVQGTRDPLCDLDELRAVLQERTSPSHLYVVETGDHSLCPTGRHLKENGLTENDVAERALGAIRSFVGSLDL